MCSNYAKPVRPNSSKSWTSQAWHPNPCMCEDCKKLCKNGSRIQVNSFISRIQKTTSADIEKHTLTSNNVSTQKKKTLGRYRVFFLPFLLVVYLRTPIYLSIYKRTVMCSTAVKPEAMQYLRVFSVFPPSLPRDHHKSRYLKIELRIRSYGQQESQSASCYTSICQRALHGTACMLPTHLHPEKSGQDDSHMCHDKINVCQSDTAS